MTEALEAAQARAAAVAAPADRPASRRCSQDTTASPTARAPLSEVTFRDATVDGKDVIQFAGYATVTERGYDMWDMFGPYTEIVSASAPAVALAADPDVAFLINHGGMTLARTKSSTLRLFADTTGMGVEATLDPRQSAVSDLRIAMERGDIDEMSFAFRITRGQWSPDYTEYRIEGFDIDRGDVSAVNYGANPFTSAAIRAAARPDLLRSLPAPELRRWERELRSALRSKGLRPAMALEDL